MQSEIESSESRFSMWLNGVSPYPKRLAWCHTTDAHCLRSILEKGVFIPRSCPVFNEDLLYFFYGRPAFRVKSDDSLRISGRAPVVAVFDPDLYLRGKRMYPFDSGAFFYKRYVTWMHEEMRLSDFELKCPSDAHQRHIASFFGCNGNYLRLQARRPGSTYAGEFEVDSFVELLLDRSIDKADDRRITLELQIDQALPASYPVLRALILPEELQDSPFIRAFMFGAGTGVEMCWYDLAPMKKAHEYQGLLEDKARHLQEQIWSLG